MVGARRGRRATGKLESSDDVVEKIISFLPIKNAVSYSLLSSRFRYSWCFNQFLVFDLDVARGKTRERMIEIINHVFAHHSGTTIKEFKLFFNPTDCEDLVKTWVSKAVAKGVEHLDLDLSDGELGLEFEFALIDTETIRVLKLSNCEIRFPPQMNGLRLLKHVCFEMLKVLPSTILSLFANCLLLEHLEIDKCYSNATLNIITTKQRNFRVLKIVDCLQIPAININAPTLSTFKYNGDFVTINVVYPGLPRLTHVSICFQPTKGIQNMSQVRELITRLRSVTHLRVNGTLLEGLAPKFVIWRYDDPQFFLPNLREFYVTIGVSLINPADILCLLRNCSHLEALFIDLGDAAFENGFYWELFGKQRLEICYTWFLSLRLVKIWGFKFNEVELQMVKFILEKARVLQKLVLVMARKNQPLVESQAAQDFYVKILSWKMPSNPNAEVEMYDYRKDKSSFHPNADW